MCETTVSPGRSPRSSIIITASPSRPIGEMGRPHRRMANAFRWAGHGATPPRLTQYGPEPALVFYTHISDQLDPYRTKVITGTPHEAPHMIDGLLYHETDLDIREHYADT